MRKITFLFLLLCYFYFSYGQKNNTDKSLVANFPFTGNANDVSSSKLKSKIINAVPGNDVTGKPNGSYYFNGINAFIEVQSVPQINLTDSFTISCWVAPETKGSNRAWVSKSNVYTQWRFGFGDASLNEWGLGHWNTDRADYFTSLDSIPLNQWTFVAVSFSKKTKKVSFYKNGKLTDAIDIAFDFLASDQPLYIGYQKEDCTFFNGNIDELKIFNRCLTEQEINAAYNELASKVVNPVFVNKTTTLQSKNGLPAYFNQADPGNIPVRFAPEYLATTKSEYSAPAITPDGKEMYWSIIRQAKDSTYQDIYFSTKQKDGKWSESQKLQLAPGNYFEGGPVLSADGNQLFIYRSTPLYNYTRALPKNAKIIRYTKVNSQWVNPVEIADGMYHSIARSGNIYYNNQQTIQRIEFKNGTYSKPDTLKHLAKLTNQVLVSSVSPDENFLIISRRNSETSGDLFITVYDKTTGKWTEPTDLTELNSPLPETFTGYSNDGKYMFLIRRTVESANDVFWVSSDFLKKYLKK